jgi:hypothetical protein
VLQVLADLQAIDLAGIRRLSFTLREESQELVKVLFVGADGLRRHVALVAQVVHEDIFEVRRRICGSVDVVLFHGFSSG